MGKPKFQIYLKEYGELGNGEIEIEYIPLDVTFDTEAEAMKYCEIRNDFKTGRRKFFYK